MTDETPEPTTPTLTAHETVLDKLLNIALSLAEKDYFALFQEHWMKVELIRGILKEGYKVREGTSTDGEDCLLWLSPDGELHMMRTTRLEEHRGDVRIHDPKMRIELKTVSEFGSRDVLQKRDPNTPGHKTFPVDVDMVARGDTEAAMLVIPIVQYDRAREQTEGPGRPAKILLEKLIPLEHCIAQGGLSTFRTNYEGTEFLVRAGKVRIQKVAVRLAIAVLRPDETLWPNFSANAVTDPGCFVTSIESFLAKITKHKPATAQS